jgi:protein gp37
MAELSLIEWTDSTWNPVTGCTKVSPGCKHCYAETFSERFRGVNNHPFEQGFDLKLWHDRLEIPLKWKKPRRIFVNSMSDLFHEEIPDEFIKKVFDTMIRADWHNFQILTKREKRMQAWINNNFKSVPSHIWLGVSIENEEYIKRIKVLQETNAIIRFISFEPLLGPIRLNGSLLEGIHWIIVGGESGHKARKMDPDWVESIKNQCERYRVSFFFKQWGEFNKFGEKVGKKRAGRKIHGRLWSQMPQVTGTVTMSEGLVVAPPKTLYRTT